MGGSCVKVAVEGRASKDTPPAATMAAAPTAAEAEGRGVTTGVLNTAEVPPLAEADQDREEEVMVMVLRECVLLLLLLLPLPD